MSTKICKDCGEEKPLSEFYRYKTRNQQVFSRCIPCVKIKRRAYLKVIVERNRTRPTIIYPESKWCYKCNQVKSSSEFHKSRIKDDGLKSECKECRHTDKESLRSYKRGSIGRNIQWELSDEEALKMFSSNCFYCGVGPRNGIDRIDSLLGYVPSNCVPCCSDCNFLKRKMPLHRFKEFVIRFHLHIARVHSYFIEGAKTADS